MTSPTTPSSDRDPPFAAPTHNASTRRSFLKVAGASLLTTGALNAQWIPHAAAQQSLLSDLPGLDGDLLLDEAHRQTAAADWGSQLSRVPLGVLRPKSVNDVVRMVAYANTHGLKIAMRGQGHSLYGQALVEGGIVIDSSTLNAVSLQADDVVVAQPGALWGDVATAALARERTPPVMPDAMMLTVGGTLSVGGHGETSYRFGAQVDHVLELDVVTGAGELVTCSADRNDELFRMVLAGLGQCGIIVSARLRLVQAPKYVSTRTLTYDDMDDFLSDQARLTQADALGPLNGRLIRDPQGRWQFELAAGAFLADAGEADRPPAWINGLRYKSAAAPATTTYWDYLNRRTANVAARTAMKKPNPSLVLTLPDSSVRPFLTHVLSTPEASLGLSFFEVSPKIPARHAQPLQKVAAGPLAYELRMQRRASAVDATDHKAMLAANQALLARALAAGGKVYPPFAPVLTQSQWQEHFGAETWTRFAAAKRRFDPKNALTPGAGIF